MKKEGYYIKENGEKITLLSADQYGSHHITDDYKIMKGLAVNNMYIEFLNKNIVEINLPSGYFSLYCNNGKVKKLSASEDTRYLVCDSNEIQQLELPIYIEYVSIINNPIKKLIITELEGVYNPTVLLSMDSPLNPKDYPNDILFRLH